MTVILKIFPPDPAFCPHYLEMPRLNKWVICAQSRPLVWPSAAFCPRLMSDPYLIWPQIIFEVVIGCCTGSWLVSIVPKSKLHRQLPLNCCACRKTTLLGSSPRFMGPWEKVWLVTRALLFKTNRNMTWAVPHPLLNGQKCMYLLTYYNCSISGYTQA